MIRNGREAVEAALKYINTKGYETHQAPMAEPKAESGRYGVTYHMGFDYANKASDLDWFPAALMLSVRASDGKVMESEEYSYEEYRLRNEDDAPEALNRYFDDRYPDHVWRLETPLERVERPSGLYYVATVLHGRPGDDGGPGPASETARLFLHTEWGEALSEASVDEEDEYALEQEQKSDEDDE